MAGRQALPIDVLLTRGKKHLTKKEIELRKQAEVKLGVGDIEKLAPPAYITNDVVAYGYWKKHIKEYANAAKSGTEILRSSDVGILCMYCKMQSEYEALMEYRQRQPLGFDEMLKLEAAINKKIASMIQMQDRLFLNPAARVKNVPKKQDKPPENPADEFGI